MPFNIGAPELIIILIIALIVLGPGKLPDVASSLGKSVREFRKAATEINDAGKLDATAANATAPAATAAAPAPAASEPAAAAAAPIAAAEAAPAQAAPAPGGETPAAPAEPAKDASAG